MAYMHLLNILFFEYNYFDASMTSFFYLHKTAFIVEKNYLGQITGFISVQCSHESDSTIEH